MEQKNGCLSSLFTSWWWLYIFLEFETQFVPYTIIYQHKLILLRYFHRITKRQCSWVPLENVIDFYRFSFSFLLPSTILFCSYFFVFLLLSFVFLSILYIFILALAHSFKWKLTGRRKVDDEAGSYFCGFFTHTSGFFFGNVQRGFVFRFVKNISRAVPEIASIKNMLLKLQIKLKIIITWI